MKVISLLAFYMLMSQGSGASLNGLNHMDKRHEAEELEDQLHLEKHKVKTSNEGEIDAEMTTTLEVTTAAAVAADSPVATELNEENILEKFGVKGFVHLVSAVFERHPEVLDEFLTRKSSLLVEHSSLGGLPRHHTKPHLTEAGGDSGSYLPAQYKKSNLLNHRTLGRHYNTAENRQKRLYHGSVFRSLEKGVAGHRQQQQQKRFGQKRLRQKEERSGEKLALPEKRSDVGKLRVASEAKSTSGSSSSSNSDDSDIYGDSKASNIMDNKNKQDDVNHDEVNHDEVNHDEVNHDESIVVTHVKVTTTKEAQNNNGNVEVSATVQPVDIRPPPVSDVNENFAVSEDDSAGDDAKYQYETDLQRTSFGEKTFSNGFPILPNEEKKSMEVVQLPELSRTQAEKRILSVKQELRDDDKLTDKQLDTERNSSVKMIKIRKPAGSSLHNTDLNQQDRDWVGVGHARQVVTSASKTTVSDKPSEEIPSSIVAQNVKESHKKVNEVGSPLQVPSYSRRRLVPRRTNRTKEIRSSENNVALQSAAKNADDMERKIQRKQQQTLKVRRLTSHQRKPVMKPVKTNMVEITTQTISNDQDSNNDEEALMSLVSHLNTNSKKDKQ